MKGAIFYYSGTGNTALACRYLARHLPVPFDLVDILRAPEIDWAELDIVGFATPTEFWGVPQAAGTFIGNLPQQYGKPAFVLNTYGAISGRTLRFLAEQVRARGFQIIGGHSLRMPESYPPMLAFGLDARNAPGRAQLSRLDSFAAEMTRALETLGHGGQVAEREPKIGLVNGLIPDRERTTARDDMGEKFVDASACTECGTCQKGCPYGAIVLDPKPVFDMSRCYGCWRCYNRCPEHAISTRKLKGGPFYTGPDAQLKAKLAD